MVLLEVLGKVSGILNFAIKFLSQYKFCLFMFLKDLPHTFWSKGPSSEGLYVERTGVGLKDAMCSPVRWYYINMCL